jgi:DNA gyrase subunit B
MKSGRFREFQAVLPLRGKVLNVEKSDIERMLQSDAIKNIIAALGCGIGKNFDIKKCRYDKLIVACDADVDGSHIQALLLTLFFNYMRPLIDNGYVYLAQPPLYRVRKGKETVYLRDDHELKEYKKKNKGNFEVNRFKGLGEMSPEQIKETVMNPQTRILRRITIDDAEKALEVFKVCMGSVVEPRRKFIEENAYKVNINFD